ncbi:EP300-interacting inhibitor of differentiation 3 [Oryctolagus cuniculus]|uniref:EP300-interacting inhibitor of differentiation 3 n=1 Tax=Oryctolagus cuniculus TaxID=9986 RepID=UPI00387A5403
MRRGRPALGRGGGGAGTGRGRRGVGRGRGGASRRRAGAAASAHGRVSCAAVTDLRRIYGVGIVEEAVRYALPVVNRPDEASTLKEGVQKGEAAIVTVTGSEYLVKPVEEEEEPMKVEMALDSDDLSSGEAQLDPILLGLEADEEKCRSIRKQYRQLMRSVQHNREDIVNTASNSLTEALEEAKVLFDGVSRTREAALDAQFLVLASDLGKEKAKQLNFDMSFFNQAAFCDFLFIFMGLNWMEDEHHELSSCDGTAALHFWETLQKEAACWMLRAENFRYIFGSFKPEPSVRKPRLEHQKRVRRLKGSGDMPTKLRKLDLSSNHEATEKEVERILGLLQTYFQKYPDSPVSYFEFVIDPNSFSRTVENIFYVSFIVRDGFARISLDQDRLPILEPISTNQVDEENDPSFHSRKQGIISLSLQDWKNIVATFEISEAMITNSY